MGYGDLVPSTPGGRAFLTGYFLAATVVVAGVLGDFVDLCVNDVVRPSFPRPPPRPSSALCSTSRPLFPPPLPPHPPLFLSPLLNCTYLARVRWGGQVGAEIVEKLLDSSTWVHKADTLRRGYVTEADYILFKLQVRPCHSGIKKKRRAHLKKRS